MKKIIWFLLTIIVFLFGFFLIKANGQIPTQRRTTCVLKTDSGTWSVLDNDTHDNAGCGDITQTSTYLWIDYTAYDTIVGNSVEEDNILNDALVMSGGSIALDHIVIYFYQNGTLINPNTITNASANIFVEVVGNDN